MKRARIVALAMIAVAMACRTLPFADPHLEGEYGKAVKKWTRRVALYSGLDTNAFVRIVYLSPEFVAAQAREISKMRAELPDKAAETLARMLEQARHPTFFAVAYMPDKTANDWNEPNSVWRIALNLGLGEKAPERVQRFEVPFNAELRVLYPYLDDYSVGYLLRFPEPSPPQLASNVGPGQTPPPAPTFSPTEAQLIIAGALGKMVFHWRVEGGPEEPTQAEAGPDVTMPKSP